MTFFLKINVLNCDLMLFDVLCLFGCLTRDITSARRTQFNNNTTRPMAHRKDLANHKHKRVDAFANHPLAKAYSVVPSQVDVSSSVPRSRAALKPSAGPRAREQ